MNMDFMIGFAEWRFELSALVCSLGCNRAMTRLIKLTAILQFCIGTKFDEQLYNFCVSFCHSKMLCV